MTDDTQKPIARRAIVTALGTGAVALGVVTGSREAAAQGTSWRPTLEEQDDWMELPGRHRMVFDSITPAGLGQAMQFARNVIEENQRGYGLDSSQQAIIVIVRHSGTMFGYNDALWAKYGEAFSKRADFLDPRTKSAPNRNLFNADDYGRDLANGGVTLSGLAEQGVHFAVCGRSTRGMIQGLVKQTGLTAEALFEDFAAHLIPNAHIVPAGIVAVNRTQERGYAFAYSG
jgi:intracellular sulfur oxidation DsrE/DsrF family protein